MQSTTAGKKILKSMLQWTNLINVDLIKMIFVTSHVASAVFDLNVMVLWFCVKTVN